MTTLYLVRHGETLENSRHILQGTMPGHLSDAGRRQAAALRDRLLAEGFTADLMLVSDLRRTLDTAHILRDGDGTGAGLAMPLIPTPLLRERDWGSLTGVAIDLARQTTFPPDVESVEHLSARVRRFLRRTLLHFPDRRIVVVSHGLFLRCLQAVVFGKTIRDIAPMANAELRPLPLTPELLAIVRGGCVADGADGASEA